MAQKKFSRLSVLLEVKDRMTKSFQNAAKAAGGLSSKVNQLGGKRATFNQLAEANAKLNREVTKLNAQLSRANSNLGSMKTNLSGIHGMGAAFGAVYAAQGLGNAANGAIKGTVGNAMEQQFSKESVGILAGADKAAPYWEQIQGYAAATAYSSEEWAKNLRGAISKSKSTEELEKFQMAMEQLATLDPVQGLDGAALAIRELNSGDITSLVERFELPRTALKQIKGIADPIKQVEALMKLVGKETGYTVEAIEKMKDLPLMQWQKFKNTAKNAFGQIGMGALTVLTPALKQVNEFIGSGKLKPYINQASKSFANLTQKAVDFVKGFSKSDFDEIKKKFEPFKNLIVNVWNTLKQAWPNIKSTLESAQSILGKIATDINGIWPTVNNNIQNFFEVVKKVSSWVDEHYEGTKTAVLALGAAWLTFKALMFIEPLIMGIVGAIKLYRAAMLGATIITAIFEAIVAAPFLLIAAGIAAVAGLAVLIYRNWEGISNFFEDMWINIRNSFANGVNDLVSSLNMLIDKFNKLTGKNVGHITYTMHGVQTRDEKNQPAENGRIMSKYGTGHRSGLNYVPYDGYEARLHKGERILTSQENKQYEGGNGIIINMGGVTVREDADINKIADAFYQKLCQAKTAMG